MAAERSGLYHLSCAGQASWYEFARAIVGDVARPRILPITTAEYPTPARRPGNSRLSNEKLLRRFGVALPRWEACLEACHAALEKSAEAKAGDRDGR